MVIEISDRLPRLLQQNAQTKDILFYFILRLPYLLVLTSPFVVLLSGLFLMSNLSKYSESIAMRSAGISIFRMVIPLFWVGIFISIMILIFGEFVLPKAEMTRQRLYTEQIRNQKLEDKKMRSHIYYLGEDKNLFYIGFFDGYRNTLKIIDITTFDENTGNIDRKITATNADWKNEEWVFQNCYVRFFVNGELQKAKFYRETQFTELDVTPLDFIKSAKNPLSMNFFELKEYIGRLKKVGEKYHEELVELYLKFSFPFANFIVLLFCVPLASTSMRSKGRGIMFALGLLVCFLFLSILRLSQSLGHNGVLSPPLAAWLPNTIFFVIGVYFVIKAEI
jgi:lipopolysaccharide export system permease protein